MSLPQHKRIEDAAFRRAVDLLDSGDVNGLQRHLAQHPGLAPQRVTLEGQTYFDNPSLLEFIAENPVRYGKLPANIVDVARAILDAGAKHDRDALNQALVLVSSGRVARQCGMQGPLIGLLCEYGADTDNAMGAAVLHGEFAAVSILLEHAAEMDLPVAAALGSVADCKEVLPISSAEERHRALAMAAQFGRTEIVRLLLDVGQDPNRYNPPASHSHSTPLHQAAVAGHPEAVRVLVERGARLDLRDIFGKRLPRAGRNTKAGQRFTHSCSLRNSRPRNEAGVPYFSTACRAA